MNPHFGFIWRTESRYDPLARETALTLFSRLTDTMRCSSPSPRGGRVPARATALLTSFLLVFALACSSGVANRNATITANPNPVPGGAGGGTTTVTWGTGDGTWGQVYLFVEGQREILFVEGAAGSNQATWINVGPVYDFRLYAGKDHKVLLASVKVTRGTS